MDEIREETRKEQLVSLGKKAREIYESPVYREIRDQETLKGQRITRELMTADPSDIENIRRLQNELHLIDLFENYLIKIIKTGQEIEDSIVRYPDL